MSVSGESFSQSGPEVSSGSFPSSVDSYVSADLWAPSLCMLLSEALFINAIRPGLSSVQSLTRVQLFATPWTAARQASLSITNSWSRLMSIKSVMSSNYLILCRPLLLLPSIFPSTRVFSNELVLCIRETKYWSFRFSIIQCNDLLSAHIEKWSP